MTGNHKKYLPMDLKRSPANVSIANINSGKSVGIIDVSSHSIFTGTQVGNFHQH